MTKINDSEDCSTRNEGSPGAETSSLSPARPVTLAHLRDFVVMHALTWNFSGRLSDHPFWKEVEMAVAETRRTAPGDTGLVSGTFSDPTTPDPKP